MAQRTETGIDNLDAIARYYHLRRYPNGTFRGKCPIHGGKSGTSFTACIKDGHLLLRCFRRCSSYRNLYDRLAADGLVPAKVWEVPERVLEVEAAAKATHWIGRGKATQEAVLQAHIWKAKDCCRNPYGASQREIAERAKVACRETVCRAQDKLIKDGWLKRPQGSNGENPTQWELVLPAGKGDQDTPNSHTYTKYEKWVDLDPPSMSHAEAFRYERGLGETARRGLGKVARRIYGAVERWGPITAPALAAKLGYFNKRGVKAQLKRLEKAGLVARMGEIKVGPTRQRATLWGLGPKSEFEVANERGLSGATQRQHDRHADERVGWRIRRKLHDPKTGYRIMPDGSVVNPTTGDMLIDRLGNRFGTTPHSDAPSGYVEVTPDESGFDAMERFLRKLGARVTVTQDGDVTRRRIEPPELNGTDDRQHGGKCGGERAA